MVQPIPHLLARQLCQGKHYLHSYPAAELSFGVFVERRLPGVCVLAAGPFNLCCYFEGAKGKDVLCLSRLWLDDSLGRNSESRTLAMLVRQLRKHQTLVKALVAYSNASVGHTGTVYRAAGFLFLGHSAATPYLRLPDGRVLHSRTLSHIYGSHSLDHFARHRVNLERVPQPPKLTYVALVDPSWKGRLKAPVLPYPTKEVLDESD